MTTIILKTIINAPIEKSFDLARSIDLHVQTMKSTREEAIEGKTWGLINLNEFVIWKARHFGIYFKMKIKITAMERPLFFCDEMIKGPFKKLRHQHFFKAINMNTEMTDIFEFEVPLGFMGKMVERLILKRHMINLLVQRNKVIKEHAGNIIY